MYVRRLELAMQAVSGSSYRTCREVDPGLLLAGSQQRVYMIYSMLLLLLAALIIIRYDDTVSCVAKATAVLSQCTPSRPPLRRLERTQFSDKLLRKRPPRSSKLHVVLLFKCQTHCLFDRSHVPTGSWLIAVCSTIAMYYHAAKKLPNEAVQ